MSDVRVAESIEIERSLADVWAFVANRLNDPKWCRKVKAVEPAGDARWMVWHKPVPLRPVALLETWHLRVEPPIFLAIREEDDASVFDVEFRLRATTRGTSLTQVSDFEWKKVPRALRPIFDYGVRRDPAGQLRALKRVLESTT